MTLFEGIDAGRINPTLFIGCAQLYALGIITRAKLITDLELTASDEVALDQLQAHYVGLTTQGKNNFFPKLSALIVALEFDKTDVATVKAQFGVTA